MNHFRIDVNLNTLQSKIHYKPKLSLQFIKRFWLFQKRRCKSNTNMLLYGFSTQTQDRVAYLTCSQQGYG